MTHDDRGEGGVKNCQNGGDVICGCPHTRIIDYFIFLKKIVIGGYIREGQNVFLKK